MGRSGLDDPIVRESFYTNESPPSPRPCRANRDSPQRLSAFPPSVLVRNNQPLILRASSTPRGRKRSLVRWITYGRKKNTGERMCFFSLWKLFSKIRSGLILTALKSAILVSLGTVTMSTTGVLWPCPGVYRHQLKVDIMTEICGGHVRLPSQHNTSSRRKKEKTWSISRTWSWYVVSRGLYFTNSAKSTSKANRHWARKLISCVKLLSH